MSVTVPATLVVGNPRPGSRTHTVARCLAERLATALTDERVRLGEADLVDLAEIGPSLPVRMSRSQPLEPSVRHALDLVCRPGLLVAVSPTFKGSYSGLLKLFLDMVPIDGLAGSVAVPAMTAGWAAHRCAGDQFLRPLLVELGATVPVPSMSILEEEFEDLSPVVTGWTARHAPTLRTVITDRAPPEPSRSAPATAPNHPPNRIETVSSRWRSYR